MKSRIDSCKRQSLLFISLFTFFYLLLSGLLGVDQDYFLGEENWTFTEILDQEIDLLPICLEKVTFSELASIPGLSDSIIFRIIKLNSTGSFEVAELLTAAGLTEDEVQRIAKYFILNQGSTISIEQRNRYQYSYSSGSYRYYNSSSIKRGQTQLRYSGQSNYGSSNLADNYTYYLFHTSESVIENFVVGKYQISTGQGIAYAPAFGFSKSASTTTSPIRKSPVLRPHTSTAKLWSLEGVAFTLNWEKLRVTPFYSDTNVNASIKEDKISTFYPYAETDPQHRNSVQEKVSGVVVDFKSGESNFGCYYSINKFDREFYNPLRKKRYATSGVYLLMHYRDIMLLGEFAIIANKACFNTGLRWGPTQFRHLLIYRQYEANTPTWHGNPFSSQVAFDNEQGLYYGIAIRLMSGMDLNAYFDLWQHPEPQYYEKMPTVKGDVFFQLQYRRKFSLVRCQYRAKEYDKYRVINNIGKIRNEYLQSYSLDYTQKLDNNFSIKTGIELKTRQIEGESGEAKGILISQLFKYTDKVRKGILQFNMIDTDLIHHLYEYPLKGMWSNRSLTGDDLQIVLLISQSFSNGLTIEAKYDRLHSIGKFNLSSQVIYRWN